MINFLKVVTYIYFVIAGGRYSGVAPLARLSFVDLAKTPSDTLTIPPVQTLYQVGYNAGARIHSNR